jgi:hypothetical protein
MAERSLLLNFEDFVRITNHSSEEIDSRYDDKPYTWAPGQYLNVHKVVATHVFGWLDPDKQYTQREATEVRERAFLRLNWVNFQRDMKYALGKLKEISIEPVPPFGTNVRVIRGRTPDGVLDDNRAPAIEVLPESTELASPGSPGPQGESGTQGPPSPPLGPEDPLANQPVMPRRVEQNIGKKR